jgi:hypothetical protein
VRNRSVDLYNLLGMFVCSNFVFKDKDIHNFIVKSYISTGYQTHIHIGVCNDVVTLHHHDHRGIAA